MHLPRNIQRTAGALAALAGAGALVSVLAAANSAGSAAAPGAPVPAAAIPRLTAIAHHAAASNGDPDRGWVTAVLTTRAEALTSAAPGDYVPGSAGVAAFLITMRGHFTATAVSVPPGAKAPTGRYLSLVIDAQTFQGLDFGIGPKPPPVPPASLAPVTYLTGRSQQQKPQVTTPRNQPAMPSCARTADLYGFVSLGDHQLRRAELGDL
jgi:hypothetical protein